MINKLFTSGANELIKNVGNVIDNLHTSKEEKLEAEQKIKNMILGYEAEMQKQVTERWKLDMQFGNRLSKSIRPLTLIFLTAIFTIISFADGNIGGFKLNPDLLPIWNTILLAVYSAYFVGRSIEKVKK
tara:strand:- start:407 stop:793 length:387 start_codon:yes stop_codon:yes gene_type:complete